jgi:hypothetical protein
MAYFFDTPDLFNMAQQRNAKVSKDIDDFVQSGPFMQYARHQQAMAAIAKEKEREAEEQRRYEAQQEMNNRYMDILAGNRGMGLNPTLLQNSLARR